MKDILSVENMRNSDAATIAGGVAQSELMRRAGRAIYESVDWKSPVAIICGKGNNGGDGYELAKHFDKDGTQYRIFDVFGADEYIPDFSGYATIVDCIFGTGFKGEVTGYAADMISAINASGAYVVSADINSGLNGDNGLYGSGDAHDADTVNSQCVISDLTVSIGSWQPGHFLGSAKDVMKKKVNCDIGIKPVGEIYHLFEMSDAAELFAPRKNNSNKGNYGYIALIGGSSRYGGAIKLAAMANAAMRSGAGVVQLAVPKGLCASIRPEILESTLFPLSDNDCDLVFNENEFKELINRVDVIAFGMGIGKSPETFKALKYILDDYEGILIIDADGLNMLSELLTVETGCLHQSRCKDIILTPHPKEFSRLTGKTVEAILHNPIESAKAFAEANRVTLLLKGPSTVVTDGDEVYICDRGCPGMATAGSGDVLSGVLAAVCASNKDKALLSAAAAAFTAGLAGELAQEETGAVSMIASDTVRYLPQAIKKEADLGPI